MVMAAAGAAASFAGDMLGFMKPTKARLICKDDNLPEGYAPVEVMFNPTEYNRTRWGLGTRYLEKPFRVSFEYRRADGMIFVGPDKMTFDQNVQPNGTNPGGADGADGKAWGAYVEGGWYIPQTNWELDARYEHYSRLTDDSGHPSGNSFESIWRTLTLGVQYHFNAKTRATLNYAFRNVETPDFASGAGPNAQMDGIDNRLALQVTAVF